MQRWEKKIIYRTKNLSLRDITKVIVTITSILALIPPAIAAINSHYQTKIEEQKLNQKYTLEWIDRATDEEKSPECRKNILEAMKIAVRGQPIEKWAGSYQLELVKSSKSIAGKRK